MRIAYFGGAFDPPHEGHLAEARAVLRCRAAEEVWFAPVFVPPHKDGSGMTDFARRADMCRKLIAGESGMTVSEVERDMRVQPSYTVDVLEKLQTRYPGDTFVLLIGGDSLDCLQDWHRGRDLAEKFEIWTYPRPGVRASRGTLEKYFGAETALKLLSRVLPGGEVPVSSSELRRSLAQGRIPERGLSPAVLDYIVQQHLYGWGNQ